jgi:hypothetical protein
MATSEKAVIFHHHQNLSLTNENIINYKQGIPDQKGKFST